MGIVRAGERDEGETPLWNGVLGREKGCKTVEFEADFLGFGDRLKPPCPFEANKQFFESTESKVRQCVLNSVREAWLESYSIAVKTAKRDGNDDRVDVEHFVHG